MLLMLDDISAHLLDRKSNKPMEPFSKRTLTLHYLVILIVFEIEVFFPELAFGAAQYVGNPFSFVIGLRAWIVACKGGVLIGKLALLDDRVELFVK